MRTDRHRPPARARYAERHPAVTVHLPDAATRARLVELSEQSGLSLGHLVKRSLGVVEEDTDHVMQTFQEGYDLGCADGHRDGYLEAVATYRVTWPCPVCGNDLEVKSGEPAAQAVSALLVEHRWAHRASNERRYG